MKKFSFLLLCTLASLGMCAQETSRVVSNQTWYGDNMGFVSNDVATKQFDYMYGKDNRLERYIVTGLKEDGEWVLTNYNRYDYNNDGQLQMTNSLQYGLYDVNSYAFKAAKDTVDYEYNEQGQLSKEYTRNTNSYYIYEYDEAGNVVRKEIYKNGKHSQTLTYSDFVKGGPQKVKAESSASYNCYDGTMTYDSFGNKLSELHYSTTGVLNYAEYWTADETGFVTLYEKKGISSGNEVDATKVEYTRLEDDRVQSSTYTYSNGQWYFKGGTKCITTYADYDAAKYAPVITGAEADNKSSKVVLTFTAPASSEVSAYNIYRNGMVVGTVEAGSTTFTDTCVPNGCNEYFIQSLVGAEKKNVSNVMAVNMDRKYPRPTNLHATTSYMNSDGVYIVSLAWKAPTLTDDTKFVSANVMKVGTYGDSPLLDEDFLITDPNTSSVVVSFSIDPVQTIYLRFQYEGGSACSETITVDATNIVGKVSEDTRQLRVVETYGDAMGNDMGITRKEITFYGDDNRVQRIATYAKAVDADANDPQSWTISSITRNIYGESGMLEMQYTQQYGRYDYGNMGFRAAQDTIFYEHDVEGQVTRQSDSKGYVEYEYAADGSLTKKHSVEYAAIGDIEQTITYSDFIGKDKPRHTESDGTANSYKYYIDTEYDEADRKLSDKTYKWSTTYQEYRASQFEQLVYGADGELQSDTIFKISISNDIEKYTPNSVTTYEAEEGNPNRVKVVKRVWDNILKKFGNPKTWNVWEYTDINAMKYSPMVEFGPEPDCFNSATFIVTVPEDMQTPMTALNIYRNGIEIAHAVSYFDDRYYTTDDYGMNGQFVYTDEKVRNGSYDYFVELAEFDATMENEAKVHNISNILYRSYYTELPAVTNLHEVSRRETTSYNSDTGLVEKNVFVTLAWDEPADKSEFGFQRYNVMIEGVQIADNEEEDGQAATYELAMRGQEQLKVYIMTVYDYGYSYSNTVIIDEVPSGIESLTPDNLTPAISKGEGVYNAVGQKVNTGYKGIVIRNGKKYFLR